MFYPHYKNRLTDAKQTRYPEKAHRCDFLRTGVCRQTMMMIVFNAHYKNRVTDIKLTTYQRKTNDAIFCEPELVIMLGDNLMSIV